MPSDDAHDARANIDCSGETRGKSRDEKAEAARAWGHQWSKQRQKLKLTVDP